MRIFHGMIISVAVLSLSACASWNQAYTAAAASALVAVQGAEDNNIRTWVVDACGTPYSAVLRNPSIAPALIKLCLPGGTQVSPADLLLKVAQPVAASTPTVALPSVSVVTPASPVTVAPLTQTAPKQAINSRKVVTTHKNAAIMAPKATVMPAPVVVPVPPAVNPFASFPAQPLPGGALP